MLKKAAGMAGAGKGSNPHSSGMKGLKHFINEIRACPSKEAQKARVIKELGKFQFVFQNAKQMGSYQRKKYVCKLLYIFMLGYPLSTNLYRESLRICSATKFSEKQVVRPSLGPRRGSPSLCSPFAAPLSHSSLTHSLARCLLGLLQSSPSPFQLHTRSLSLVSLSLPFAFLLLPVQRTTFSFIANLAAKRAHLLTAASLCVPLSLSLPLCPSSSPNSSRR